MSVWDFHLFCFFFFFAKHSLEMKKKIISELGQFRWSTARSPPVLCFFLCTVIEHTAKTTLQRQNGESRKCNLCNGSTIGNPGTCSVYGFHIWTLFLCIWFLSLFWRVQVCLHPPTSWSLPLFLSASSSSFVRGVSLVCSIFIVFQSPRCWFVLLRVVRLVQLILFPPPPPQTNETNRKWKLGRNLLKRTLLSPSDEITRSSWQIYKDVHPCRHLHKKKRKRKLKGTPY